MRERLVEIQPDAILYLNHRCFPVYHIIAPAHLLGAMLDDATLNNSPYALRAVFGLKRKSPRLNDRKEGNIERNNYPLFDHSTPELWLSPNTALSA
jgi:hypothetical protein